METIKKKGAAAMKEKFRNFFAKHRHLIVISLILAILLAALTPKLIPLGLKLGIGKSLEEFPELKAEDIMRITVQCFEHNNREQRYFQLLFNDERTLGEGMEDLCTLLSAAPTTPCLQTGGEKLCSFSVHWIRAPKGVNPLVGATYSVLRYPDGRYSLHGTAHYGSHANWYISEESASALLAHRRCEAEPDYLEFPRRDVCNAEDVVSATLYTWVQLNQSESQELTQAQIETFCAFLEEELLPAEFEQEHTRVRHGKTGWQVILTKQDGTIWYVQYNETQGGLSLARQYPKGERPPRSAGYTCEDEAVVAGLPDLLRNAEQ